jgi:hypothetical protein
MMLCQKIEDLLSPNLTKKPLLMNNFTLDSRCFLVDYVTFLFIGSTHKEETSNGVWLNGNKILA